MRTLGNLPGGASSGEWISGSRLTVWDFLNTAYEVSEGSFVERIVQGYGRQAFPEPDSIKHRYFTEDIPFGLVIWSSLAAQIGLAVPLTDSFIALSGPLSGQDFVAGGRTAKTLGLLGSDVDGIRAAFIDGVVQTGATSRNPPHVAIARGASRRCPGRRHAIRGRAVASPLELVAYAVLMLAMRISLGSLPDDTP